MSDQSHHDGVGNDSGIGQDFGLDCGVDEDDGIVARKENFDYERNMGTVLGSRYQVSALLGTVRIGDQQMHGACVVV